MKSRRNAHRRTRKRFTKRHQRGGDGITKCTIGDIKINELKDYFYSTSENIKIARGICVDVCIDHATKLNRGERVALSRNKTYANQLTRMSKEATFQDFAGMCKRLPEVNDICRTNSTHNICKCHEYLDTKQQYDGNIQCVRGFIKKYNTTIDNSLKEFLESICVYAQYHSKFNNMPTANVESTSAPETIDISAVPEKYHNKTFNNIKDDIIRNRQTRLYTGNARRSLIDPSRNNN
jgi:hypothetical protein